MGAFQPACAAPACSLNPPDAPNNDFNDFLRSPERAGRFIVEVDAFPNDAAPLTRPSLPACGAPACSIPGESGSVSQSVLYKFSDHPVFTEPDDDLSPNYFTEARISNRADIETAFSIVPTTSQASQTLIGDVELYNSDAWLDDVVNNFSIDGRSVRLKFGPENGEYSDYRTIDEVFGSDWKGDQGEIRLGLQDLQFRLDQPYQTATYRGTGGIEGDASITGDLKPRLVGYRDNFTPKLIDAANKIYQISDSPIANVVAARDGGDEFTDSTIDVATYGALVAADLDEGEYATALSVGLVRIRPAGAALQSIFTVAAYGDDTEGVSTAVGDIILYELRSRAGFDDSEIDPGSFNALNGFQAGYYFSGDADRTFRQVFNQLTKQTNGRIIADSRIRAIRIVNPSTATFNYEVEEGQIFDLEPEGVLYPPIIKLIVRYLPNDVPLSPAEIIDPEDDPAKKAALQKEYISIERLNGTTRLRHKGAQKEVTITTDLIDETSAVTLIDAVNALWSQERNIYKVTVNREALFFAVGSVVKVTHHRYGFSAGRNGLIVAKRNDYNSQTAELRILV